MVTEIVVVIVASIFEGGKTPVREYDVFKNEMLNNGTSLASCASFTDELNIDIEDEWFLQEDYENVENEIWFVLHNIPAGVYTLDTKYGAEYDTKQNRTAQISVSASTNSKANKVVMEAYPLRDWKMFIGEYVYIQFKKPTLGMDEVYGTLFNVDGEMIELQYMVKNIKKKCDIKYDDIAFIRLAVKF